jgi:hypothetical protein
MFRIGQASHAGDVGQIALGYGLRRTNRAFRLTATTAKTIIRG